jgi:hypothetical protein
VVRIAEFIGTPPVVSEEPQGSVEPAQFVEVDSDEEDPVFEPVAPRDPTLVHHAALVEARAERDFLLRFRDGHRTPRLPHLPRMSNPRG